MDVHHGGRRRIQVADANEDVFPTSKVGRVGRYVVHFAVGGHEGVGRL